MGIQSQSKSSNRIIAAAHALAGRGPATAITIADLAREAGVSWPTVRRHVGGREGLTMFLVRHGILSPDAVDAASDMVSDDTRRNILDAAYRVFAREGYTRSTLDLVAAEIGMTKGAVYWHFATKRDLFLALIDMRLHEEADEAHHRLEAYDPDESVGFLARVLENEMHRLQHADSWARLGFEFLSESRDPQVGGQVDAAYTEIDKANEDIMALLIRQGTIRGNHDPVVIAILWRALLSGLAYVRLSRDKSVDLTALGPALTDILWNGIRPDSS